MKICLVGSGRFKALYDEYNIKLTLAGHLVYSIAMVSSSTAEEYTTPDQKETLDLVHLLKILESEAVLVVTDPVRYVGESTRRELKWAAILGRRVFWSLNEVPRECYPEGG